MSNHFSPLYMKHVYYSGKCVHVYKLCVHPISSRLVFQNHAFHLSDSDLNVLAKFALSNFILLMGDIESKTCH